MLNTKLTTARAPLHSASPESGVAADLVRLQLMSDNLHCSLLRQTSCTEQCTLNVLYWVTPPKCLLHRPINCGLFSVSQLANHRLMLFLVVYSSTLHRLVELRFEASLQKSSDSGEIN